MTVSPDTFGGGQSHWRAHQDTASEGGGAARPSLDHGPGPPREGASEGASEGIDLRFLLGVLRRHKYMIAGLVFFITGCAALYVGQLTPLYRASAQVLIEPDRRNFVPVQEVMRGMPLDWQTAQTEAAVIGSRELARRAVERLQLADSELFNPRRKPEQDPPGLVAQLKDVLRDAAGGLRAWLRDSGITSEPRAQRPEAATAAPRLDPWQQQSLAASDVDPLTERLASYYLSGLSVIASETSRVITVRYTSVNPRFAAVAANTTASLYIESQREEKEDVTSNANEWLQNRVEEVQRKLLDSERKLEAFRRETGLSNASGPSLPAQQLAQINRQLVEARANAAEARARYRQVQELLKEPGRIETSAAVLDSDLIEKLRVQEIELNRRIAELETQYRDSHPKMVNARAELQNLQDRIEAEVGKIASNLRNELDVAQVRVANLESEIGRLQAEIDDLNSAEVKLRTLQSEVDANRDLYRTLLNRLKETSVQDTTVQQPDARIISAAQPPGGPFYPNEKIFIAMALIISSGLAVALAFLLEYLDAGYRSLTQIENQTGFPTFGIIPQVKLRRDQRPHGTLAIQQGSVFAEAIRTLRTSLLLSHTDQPPRVVLVTSSIPSEGKTSTTLSLAAQTMQTGRRCIVIDCDLRVANLGSYLGYPERIGLSDFLAGNARLDEIIEIDPTSGVHFIAAGSRVHHPDELLGGPVMRRLVQALAAEYQMVILDTPPVLAVSDALVLAAQADVALYLTRWGKTKRELVQRGVKLLRDARAPFIGVALTYVDIRRHAQYDYADTGHYYGKSYRKYYGAA